MVRHIISLTAAVATLSAVLLSCSSAPNTAPRTARDPASIGGHDWEYVQVPVAGGETVGHWQIKTEDSVLRISDPRERAAEARRRQQLVDQEEGTTNGCPVGMVRVQGNMNDWRTIVKMQDQSGSCLEPKKWNPAYLCNKFNPDKLKFTELETTPMDFCVDRYEYPNLRGEYPAIMVSWYEAEKICKSQGKRLCTENEWTFACEGPLSFPYPYGYDREPGACNVDHKLPKVAYDPKNLEPKSSEKARRQIDVLWLGQPSGAHGKCKSVWGVYDLTGNIDEWASHSQGRPQYVDKKGFAFPSKMKGGWWFPGRSRCQPATFAHGPDFIDFQQGFRCCAEAPGTP